MKKILVWGTGYIANTVFDECQTLNQYEFVGVIDNDKTKWGKYFRGILISSPEVLLKEEAEVVVILTDKFEEIKKQIEDCYPDIDIRVENKNYFYKESILLRYQNNKEPEIEKVLEYIKENGLEVFNYPFVLKYKDKKNKVWKDEENQLYFVVHNGKRMYFSRKFESEKEVNDYYNSLLMEQDEKSPHRYWCEKCYVEQGDIVLDVGVAEGNFSLDVIDRAAHLYLVEAEDEWIEALQCTFKNYADKVTIIKGYATSYNEGLHITLDAVIDSPVNFIKMDIEGNEWDALRGATQMITNSSRLKLAICSYHSDFDQELIESFMDKNGISHNPSAGYMWFPTKLRQTYVSTSLNKSIIRGIKEKR